MCNGKGPLGNTGANPIGMLEGRTPGGRLGGVDLLATVSGGGLFVTVEGGGIGIICFPDNMLSKFADKCDVGGVRWCNGEVWESIAGIEGGGGRWGGDAIACENVTLFDVTGRGGAIFGDTGPLGAAGSSWGTSILLGLPSVSFATENISGITAFTGSLGGAVIASSSIDLTTGVSTFLA